MSSFCMSNFEGAVRPGGQAGESLENLENKELRK